MPATLADAKTVVALLLGMKSTDSRVVVYINEAIQRLLPRGKWVGTTARMRFCVYSRCLTFPRQVETVESYAVDSVPGRVVNDWYEYLPAGPGTTACGTCNTGTLIPKGFAPAFDDIRGTNSKIWVISDQNEAATSQILLLGYDSNRKWVRTLQNGVIADGELVTITGAGTASTTVWYPSGLTAVIKPITIGNVSLFELDGNTGLMRSLAVYEPDEKQPRYRRYMLPSVCSNSSSSSCCDDTNTEATCVDAMVKLAFIPARLDNDILLIGNLPAIKDMVQSIRFAENNLLDAAMNYELKAIKTLDDELKSYLGDGPVMMPKFEYDFGATEIGNIFTY